MKINWKIRVKNPLWWAELVVALFAPILAHAGMGWEQVTSWASLGSLLLGAVQNPVVVVAVVVVSGSGVKMDAETSSETGNAIFFASFISFSSLRNARICFSKPDKESSIWAMRSCSVIKSP